MYESCSISGYLAGEPQEFREFIFRGMSTRGKKLAEPFESGTTSSVYGPTNELIERLDKNPDPKGESGVHVSEEWISAALDVFKGIFIIFMLTEHTRSGFSMKMTSGEPIMQFVSQVACSLDMTCFSTAYGFSCYRSYLTNSKGRSMKSQLWRLFRSIGLISAAAWACNVSFELAVLQNPPTWESMRKIFTFDVVYWDFLTTFPAMLLTAFVTTKPLMTIASKSPNQFVRLSIFAVLIIWPLLASNWALDTCPTALDRYKAIFMGCVRRTLGAMRFSAFTYMFYFNFGCIVSMLTLEHSKSGAKPSVSMRDILTKPHWIAYGVLLAIELYYALPIFQEYNRSWEYLNWEGYRRFPMTAPLTLAWGFMSQSVGVLALVLTAIVRPQVLKLSSSIQHVFRNTIGVACKVLEHFGANVLLYLTVSNIVIHAFFNIDWRRFQIANGKSAGKGKNTDLAYSIRQWEYVVVAAAIGQILFVQLLSYMIRSSRK